MSNATSATELTPLDQAVEDRKAAQAVVETADAALEAANTALETARAALADAQVDLHDLQGEGTPAQIKKAEDAVTRATKAEAAAVKKFEAAMGALEIAEARLALAERLVTHQETVAKVIDRERGRVAPGHGARVEYGLADYAYHAATHILSASGAKRLTRPGGPALYHYEATHPRPYKAAFEIGHAAHTLATGTGAEFAVIEADDWRTTAAREARTFALVEGKTPLLRKEYDAVRAMADALLDHPLAASLLTRPDLIEEASIYWTQDGVPCRARPDLALPNFEVLIDYKTTVDASPEVFAKRAAEYGYHLQEVWYRDGVEAYNGQQPPMVFLVQEKTAPFRVAVYELDAQARRVGRELAAAARSVFRDCTATGDWPAYDPGLVTLSLPGWALNKDSAAIETMTEEAF